MIYILKTTEMKEKIKKYIDSNFMFGEFPTSFKIVELMYSFMVELTLIPNTSISRITGNTKIDSIYYTNNKLIVQLLIDKKDLER